MKHIISTITFLLGASFAVAQECVLPVRIQFNEEFANVPDAACKVLYNSLNRIACNYGLTTEAPTSQFLLTAHCDVLDKSNLPGPPIQSVYNLGVTLYIADTYAHKKFATAYIKLNGVGTGEVKSYTNAFNRINLHSQDIKSFIQDGKKKMLQYYDTQYPAIIKEARRLASLKNYEEALAMVTAIPACSRGGDEAMQYAQELYQEQLDRFNLYLLNSAKALWAAGQDQDAAYHVCELLAQIDPDAKCYPDASKLMSEVKQQVRSDIDFEMRQKYNDQVSLAKMQIDTARAIGVAYGNNQKPTTTNLMWLK